MEQRRLLQLLRDNLRGEGQAPKFEVKASADEATILLYDVIDPWFGIAAKDFVAALAGIQAPVIHLRINSPGGDVFEARAMATAIRQHKSAIIAHVDGVAASAATGIAVACKEVEMTDGALFMVHQAWAFAFGNTDDMLAMAGLLEKVDAAIAADYVKKTGKSTDQVAAWMAAETWFTAQEAKDAGFVDRIAAVDANSTAPQDRSLWNLSAYRNAPKMKPAPSEPQFDRAALERRLVLFEKTRIAA